jgi:Holliday junction resolvasome RuvABC endonuclease subunit
MKTRVMAIDGALNKSGWVVLDDMDGTTLDSIVNRGFGIISPDAKMPLGFKLSYIRSEITKLMKTYKPSVVVLEDTFSGPNRLTAARLNNAKGVFVLTVYEVLRADPIYANVGRARGCLGFTNKKDEPFAFFQERFNIAKNFKNGNDITDACTLGFWYILNSRGDCARRTKAPKKKEPKSVKQ